MAAKSCCSLLGCDMRLRWVADQLDSSGSLSRARSSACRWLAIKLQLSQLMPDASPVTQAASQAASMSRRMQGHS